jgi:hypothetical protein
MGVLQAQDVAAMIKHKLAKGHAMNCHTHLVPQQGGHIAPSLMGQLSVGFFEFVGHHSFSDLCALETGGHLCALLNKNTTHRTVRQTAVRVSADITSKGEDQATETGRSQLAEGGEKHGSGTLRGCWASRGHLGLAPQDFPGHIGAEFFAAHLAASGLLDLGAANDRDLAVKLVVRRQAPLRDSARRNAELDCKLGATTYYGDGFFNDILC